MIVADTSAVVALLDADEAEHDSMRVLWEQNPNAWLLPWAVLPEIDYLVRRHLGVRTARLFLHDIAGGTFAIEHGHRSDLVRAHELNDQYADLALGLIDGVVAAVAERLRAEAIVTLDMRHFGALELRGKPRIYPRDLDR